MITGGILNLLAFVLGGYLLLHAGNEAPQQIAHDAPSASVLSSPVLAQSTIHKVVIVDIGGVLASYSSTQLGMRIFKQVTKDVGFFKALKYAASQKKLSSHLRSLIFQIF
jgi:hypothetical protein